MRRPKDLLARLAGREEDLLLPLLHALDVLGEGGGFGFAVRRDERDDAQQSVPVVRVRQQTFLEDLAELSPQGAVVLGTLGLQLLDRGKDLLGQPATDRLDLPVLLQNFAGNVERHVLCVDDALDETQVLGHQLVAVAHDEDAFDVQVDPDRRVPAEQIERRVRRNEEQGLVLEGALGLHGDDLERVVPHVRDVLVELLVLLVGDLVFRPGPECLHRVEGLGLDGDDLFAARLGGRGASLDLHADGPGNEVGVLLDQVPDLPFLGVVVQVVLGVLGLEVQGDRRSLRRPVDGFDGVGAVAARLPSGGLALAGLARQQLDFVGHDEDRIEADAELTDQVLRRSSVLGLS